MDTKKEKIPIALEKLPSDLLMMILSRAGDPVYFGRLMLVSAVLYQKLRCAQTNGYWQLQLQRDFPDL